MGIGLNTKYQCKHIDENGVRCKRTQKILSKGMCDFHRDTANSRKSTNTTKTEYEKKLDRFFKEQLSVLGRFAISEHSGVRINYPKKSNIAHLFPKRYFKSIATDPENIIFLTWGEHSTFDGLLDKFEFKRLEEELELGWEIAVTRMANLIDKIPEEEQNSFYRKIKKYIENRS